MMSQIREQLLAKHGVDAADVATADEDSVVFHDMQGYDRVAAAFQSLSLVNTKTLTGTLLQATDAAGTGKKALGSAKVITSGATGPVQGIVEASAIDLDHANGFRYVGIRLRSNDTTPATGSAMLLFGNADKEPVGNA